MHFADALKQSVATVFGVSVEMIEKWKRWDEIPPGWPHSVRTVLQRQGEAIRAIDPDFWILPVLRYRDAIVADVRYENEARAVGVVLRIDRPGCELSSHPSETELDNWPWFDGRISNDGSREDLRIAVIEWWEGCVS